MTLSDPMEDAAAAGPPAGKMPRKETQGHDGHRHGPHPHDHAGHNHSHGAPASVPVSRRRRRGFAGERLFLASAVERMALALVVVAAIWLAVFWAMG